MDLELVPCSFVPLASAVDRYQLPVPSFVKVDVKGAELAVLLGARELVRVHRPLMFIEIFAPWERSFGYTPWEVLSLLKEWGYSFLFACPDGLVSHDASVVSPTPPQYVNGYNTVAFVQTKHASRIAALHPSFPGGSRPVGPMVPAPLLNL
jgi:hypothetical protein